MLRSRLPGSTTADPAQAQLYKVWGVGMQLQPGESLEWPLLLHPASAGKMTVHCLWYCEPTVRRAEVWRGGGQGVGGEPGVAAAAAPRLGGQGDGALPVVL